MLLLRQLLLELLQEQHERLTVHWCSHSSANISVKPTVSMVNLQAPSGQTWLFENLNVNIVNSSLSLKTLTFNMTTGLSLTINVQNSSMALLYFIGNYQVDIYDLHFTFDEWIFTIYSQDSSVAIRNCVFVQRNITHDLAYTDDFGNVFMIAISSQVTLTNVQFKNVGARYGLIQMQDSSHLMMRNVSFLSNGFWSKSKHNPKPDYYDDSYYIQDRSKVSNFSLITLTNNSSARVEHGVMSHNVAWKGTCFHVGSTCSVELLNSTFNGNIAGNCGGVLCCESDSKLDVRNCVFDSNTVDHGDIAFLRDSPSCKQTGGGVMMCDHRVSILMTNCTFQNNTCGNAILRSSDGAVLRSGDNTSLHIQDSRVLYNTNAYGVFYTGRGTKAVVRGSEFSNQGTNVFYFHHRSHVFFEGCNFQSNNDTAMYAEASQITINKCKFNNNTLNDTIGIFDVWQNNKLVINNSLFGGNSWQDGPKTQNLCAVICVAEHSSAHLENTEFFKNLLSARMTLIRSEESVISMKNCSFSSEEKRPVISGYGATFSIENSHFPKVYELPLVDPYVERPWLRNSVLTVKNTVFPWGVYLVLAYNSSARFENCTLQGYDSCLIVHSQSRIEFHKCTLEVSGGVITRPLPRHTGYMKDFFSVYVARDSFLSLTKCIHGCNIWSESNSTIDILDSEAKHFAGRWESSRYFIVKTELFIRNSTLTYEYFWDHIYPPELHLNSSILTAVNVTVRRGIKMFLSNSNATFHRTAISVQHIFLNDTTVHPQYFQIAILQNWNNYLIIQDTSCETGNSCLSLNLTQTSNIIVERSTVQMRFSSRPGSGRRQGSLRISDGILITEVIPPHLENTKWWPSHFATIFTWNVTLVVGNETLLSSDSNFLQKAQNIMLTNSTSGNGIFGTKVLQDGILNQGQESQALNRLLNTSLTTERRGTPNSNKVSNVGTLNDLNETMICQHHDTPFAAGEIQYLCPEICFTRKILCATDYWFICCFPVTAHNCPPCFCHFDVKSKRNIFNCTNITVSRMPQIPQLTHTVFVSKSQLQELSIDDIIQINESSAKSLDLTSNRIKKISSDIQHLDKLDSIWLAGNLFHCDCSMTWMITWLNTRRNSSTENLVRDFQDIICRNSKFDGLPIYLLSDVLLGCYPSKWSSGQKVGLAVASAVILLVFCLTIISFNNSREVKFLLFYYLKLDTVAKDDKHENLEGKEYDAFLCFT